MIDPSFVADFGVGDETSICAQRGCLWGRGEISMRSFMGPGEDDGRGGVVTLSIIYISSPLPRSKWLCLPRPSNVPKRFDVKSDRRGVGNCGLKYGQ
jgi:hypothetical protein